MDNSIPSPNNNNKHNQAFFPLRGVKYMGQMMS